MDNLLWLQAEGLALKRAPIADPATITRRQVAYQFRWDIGSGHLRLSDAKAVEGEATGEEYLNAILTNFLPANALPIFNASGELLGSSLFPQRPV